MKKGNLALSLSIVSAVVLFLSMLLYSGSNNVGSMRSQIGTDISAVNVPNEVNAIAVNRVQHVNSLAVNRIQPVNSFAVNRIQPVNSFAKVVPVNSAATLVAFEY